jgi:hypothetical protein
MKALLTVVLMAFAAPSFAEAQIKEVCKDKKTANGEVVKGKDGKPIQVCKKIKVHQKHEGTKVPPK